MLSSGILEKGDIIMSVAQGNFGDFHIGFFWGDSPSENRFWHSIGSYGNIISKIVNYKNKTPSGYYWYVIKLADGDGNPGGAISVFLTDSERNAVKNAVFSVIRDGKETAEMVTGSSG